MKINNQTDGDHDSFIKIVKQFVPFAQKQIGFNRPPTLNLVSDSANAADPMGKTAFYNPSDEAITVFTDGRHPKDMLRSVSHELVHHAQKCNGEFENMGPLGEDYAQTNPHLRGMEEDANLRGNMCVRDFVDQQLHLNESKRRNKKMVNENSLRLAINKLIAEVIEEEGLEESEYVLAPDASPEEMLALVAQFVADKGITTQPPGMTDAGRRALERDHAWRKSSDKGELAAAADAADDPELGAVATEEEEIVATENVLKISREELKSFLNEARRRRWRRQAIRDRAAAAAPAAPKAAEPKVEPKKEKELVAKKVPKKKALKEWDGDELFEKLVKEAVKK